MISPVLLLLAMAIFLLVIWRTILLPNEIKKEDLLIQVEMGEISPFSQETSLILPQFSGAERPEFLKQALTTRSRKLAFNLLRRLGNIRSSPEARELASILSLLAESPLSPEFVEEIAGPAKHLAILNVDSWTKEKWEETFREILGHAKDFLPDPLPSNVRQVWDQLVAEHHPRPVMLGDWQKKVSVHPRGECHGPS